MARRKPKQEEPKVEEQVVNGEDTLLGEAQVVDELPADVKLLRREVTRLRNKLQSAEAGTDVIVDAIKEVFADVMDPKAYGRPIKTPPASRKKHEETALLHLTDLHFGKVTPLFSSEIATERIESIAQKVLKITEVRRAAASLDEIVVFIGGDDIQSEVVPGGVLHIDEGVFEQACYTCPEALLRLILFLAQHYRKVRVYGVPGNHGRPFPSRKTPKGPRTNWDLVCLRVLEVMLMGPDGSDPWGLKGRVEFCEIGHWYQLARIYDWGALLVHGDQIRGGFAGFPWYGAAKKAGGWADVVPAMESIYGVDGRWDHVYFGHFHQHVSGPAGARRWFATGSLESFDPYAAEELASWGPASQRMNIYDPDIGVIAEMPLYVEPVRPVTRAHEPLGEIPVGPRWHGK